MRSKLMGTTTHSINVKAPLRAVYNQWTQFEEFPRFMEGVDEVLQEGPAKLFWRVTIGGKEKCWEAEITEQIPDQRIAWRSIEGAPNSGEVTFDSLDADLTRVTLTIEYEPEGLIEKAGDALGMASGRVEKDLKRFRDYIEERGIETGAWRGRIKESDHSAIGAPPEKVGVEERLRDVESGVVRDEEQTSVAPPKRCSSESAEPAIRPTHEDFQTPEQPVAQEFYRESATILAPTHEQIARRAYELYKARGEMPGHQEEDWLEAERQLSREGPGSR